MNGFQQYVREIIKQFEKVVKSGNNIGEEYKLIIQSIFWVCKAVGVTGTKKANVDEVYAAIRDKDCLAWKMKLKGKKFVKLDAVLDLEDEEDPIVMDQPWRSPAVDDLLKDERQTNHHG